MPEALSPIVVLLAFLAIDLWVYADAKRSAAQGTPVMGTYLCRRTSTGLLGAALGLTLVGGLAGTALADT